MYNSDTEVLFPLRAIPELRGIRGPEWDELIDLIISDQVVETDKLAFVLMIVRLVGCAGCNSDSFRAMRGCTKCVQQTIRRFRGEDHDLIKLFEKAKNEIALKSKNE